MNWTRTGKWLTTVAAALALAACGNSDDKAEDTSSDDAATEESDAAETTEETATEEEGDSEEAASGDFDTSQSIHVVSREQGSGTRDAFTEITGVMDEETEEDNTTAEATEQSSTGAVLSTVAGDPTAIGYISLGSLDGTVKAVKVDGVEATPENVQAEEYPIYRPFNIAYGKDLSPAAQDFWNYIFSPEAQAIVEEEGFISLSEDKQEEYTMDESAEGQVTITGSTSVEPAMQAIADAYSAVNSKVTVNIQANGSGAGMQEAIDGANDFGMASRALSEEESGSLTSEAMALDGIAVVVHNDNTIEDLTVDQVRAIFVGEVATWADVSA